MTLTEEMKSNIDSYGSRITTLKDFVTAVRQMPGMYLGGDLGNAGFKNMIREISQNALDQLLDPMSPCDWFKVYYNMQTLEVQVTDNGSGLPFNDIIRILTTNHTSKNFVAKEHEYHSGLHGSGSKVVNAMSDIFVAESYRYDGNAVKVEFHKGYPTTKAPVKIKNPKKLQGTKITFTPDMDIMSNIDLEWKTVYHLIKDMMCLTPLGSHMTFEAIDQNGKRFVEEIKNTDGIVTNIIDNCKHPIIRPIVVGDDDGTRKLDCAFCFDSGDSNNGPDSTPYIKAYCNFCPTVGGTHIKGVQDGITRWFTNYMNTVYLANQKAKDKLKVIASDILSSGLVVMIAAAHIEPNLIGQSKEILSNPDMEVFAKEKVMARLDQWAKSSPQDLAKICKYFKDIADVRQKAESSKAKIVKKYESNVITGLPSKYIRPLQNKNVELVIVEGDSALGTAHTSRDPQTQG